jgi:ribosome-associated heat shock protein Hsp15
LAAGTTPEKVSDALRLDKWLWHARFTRTRALASRLIETEQVRLNGKKTDKAHHPIRPGDVLTFAAQGRIWVVRVLALSEHRLGAPAARTLFEEIPVD